MSDARHSFARLFKAAARIEPYEVRAVVIAFVYFFLLLGSYFILRPVRDAMATAYGTSRLQDLFTATFVGTFILAPIYAYAANRIKLATLLPWVYGVIVITILIFYALFATAVQDRWVAAAFYVWVSVFNMLITSVFWSFMADLFSRTQAKRLYGFIAAGGSIGAAAGPALTAALVRSVGTNTLLLISAGGFTAAIVAVRMLVREKEKLRLMGDDPQRTTLDHTLASNPFAGFSLVAKSPYLMGMAVFILLMTWVSTILYFQQQDLIAKAFASREARTQAFALVDLIVNVLTIGIQMFGTGRMVARFGVTTGLVVNPLLMVLGFIAVALSPVLWVLLSAQIIRRVSEYAFARPSREMLFTVVDQEAKYKAKNVIDTVVYRFGDLSAAWMQTGLAFLGLGISGVAVFGVGVCGLWWWVARALGRRYENVTGDRVASRPATAAAE